MEGDVLKFSDFIQDDGLFERLQILLNGLDEQLGSVTNSAKLFAKALDASVKAGEDTEEVAAIIEGLRKAYTALVKTQTEAGRMEAALNEVTKQQGKVQSATARQVINAAGSYYQLQAALEEVETKYKMLSESERNSSAEAKKYLSDIKDLKTKIGELNREIGNIGLVTTEDKLRAQIANLQKEGQVMADLRQQITAFKAAQKGLAEGKFFSVEGIAQAEELRRKFEALDKNAEDYDTQLKKLISDTQKLVAAEKRIGKSFDLEKTALTGQGVSVSRTKSGQVTNVEVVDATKLSYEQLTAVYKLATEALRSYNVEQLQTDETAKKLIETQANTVAQLNKFDQATGKVSRQWDGLRMQVTQVVRELPSIAISANTFFLAISNNIPYLADEISKARQENEKLKESGQASVPIIKRVVKALVSWNTILVVILAVLSIWGKDILEWVKSALKFEKGVNSLTGALKGIRDELKKTNGDFAKHMSAITRLQLLWKDTSSVEEREAFLEKYRKELDDTGISITKVSEAEKVFEEYTDTIKEAFLQRAMAAAASKKAEEEYEEALEKWNRKSGNRELINSLWEQVDALNALKEEFKTNKGVDPIAFLKERLEEVPTAMRVAFSDIALQDNSIGGLADNMAKQIEFRIGVLRTQLDMFDESMQQHISNAKQYSKAYLEFEEEFRKQIGEIGLETTETKKKQQDLLAKLNQQELTAMKRRNNLEEAIMADGYVKNVKKIRDGYTEQRKEIENQIHTLKEVLRKEWGFVFGLSNIDVLDETGKKFVALVEELIKDLDTAGRAESADLGKEWLSEQTRRAEAAKDAVQLQLDAVREGSEEEYDLKMKLIWKEYNAEIAANKEKEKSKRQDSLAIYAKYLKQEEDLRNAYDRTLRERQIKQLELEIGSTAYGREASTKTEQKIELQRKQALADIEQSGLSSEEQEAKRLATEQYYDRLILQERIKLANQLVKVEKDLVSIETDLAQKNSAEKLRLLLEQNNIAEQTELNNAYLSATSEEEYAEMADHIIQKYKQLENFIKGDFAVNVLDDQQALAEAVFNIVEQTEQDITRFELEQEKERWTEQIRLAEAGMLDWSEAQIAAAKATVEGINNQLKQLEGIGGVLSRISEHGLLGLFDMTDAQYDAWENYADFIGDQIDKIIDKYVELAQAAVDAQQQQVDAARTVYEAELEARANGYANNVETAKKELQLQKQTLKEKQKRLEEAERYQRIADEASTASSLITAIAQLYKAYAGVPYVGLIIAAAAVTGLLGMFAAGKASAKAAAAQNYGHGGFEVLQGGSHASGNDIDLGVSNRHNRRMRAEGGESMAIFSRRATKRYGEVLPDLVASINKGNFEEQYSQSFVLPDEVKLGIGKERYVNLSKIESSLDQLTSQGAEQYSVMPDGTVIIKKGNVTKIIKK